MKGSKKCPHCGQWSVWSHAPTDRCEHCQRLLDPAAFNRQQAQHKRKEEEKKRFTVDLIQINPTDSTFAKFWKSIGLGFQLAFVGIISFILWLIALLAG
jgi:methionyl-tRNA synthetase